MPQAKKHPSLRRRRNKAATASTLTVVEAPDYGSWSLPELHAEIDRRNEDCAPGDDLAKPKTKPACVRVLESDDEALIPELPEREPLGWHSQVRAWWREVWTSPMSDEWHSPTDFHNVLQAAMHYHDMWIAETPTQRQKASAEFGKILVPLGLTPYARRRLEWAFEEADAARSKGRRRRAEAAAGPPIPSQPVPGSAADPRAGLALVQ